MPKTIRPPVTAETAADRAADRAKAVDAGLADPRETLEELAAEGLLTLGVPGLEGSLAEQAAVIERLAAGCLATAFCAWGHRLTLEYLAPVSGSDFEALARFDRIGSSAMAGAFKAEAGLEPLAVKGRRDGSDLVLDGRIPWASNLHQDTIVVLAVDLEGEGPTIVSLPLTSPGVTVRPMRDLLSLEATASGQIQFEAARFTAAAIHPEPFERLLDRVRRPFLTLQSAYCVGLTRTALAAVGSQLEGVGVVFADDAEELQGRLESVTTRLSDFTNGRQPSPRDLVELRLDSAVLAREAVRTEAAVTGGRGFLTTSPTGRRIREAAFLPVQSPTEGQLRWQLQQSA